MPLCVCQDHTSIFTEHLLGLCLRIVHPAPAGFGVTPKEPRKMVHIMRGGENVILDNDEFFLPWSVLCHTYEVFGMFEVCSLDF